MNQTSMGTRWHCESTEKANNFVREHPGEGDAPARRTDTGLALRDTQGSQGQDLVGKEFQADRIVCHKEGAGVSLRPSERPHGRARVEPQSVPMAPSSPASMQPPARQPTKSRLPVGQPLHRLHGNAPTLYCVMEVNFYFVHSLFLLQL